jgi:hypothetical protein
MDLGKGVVDVSNQEFFLVFRFDAFVDQGLEPGIGDVDIKKLGKKIRVAANGSSHHYVKIRLEQLMIVSIISNRLVEL